MARPQAADGGTVSNMEGSSRGHSTRGGPPAWWLGEALTIRHFIWRRTCTDLLVQDQQWKGDFKTGRAVEKTSRRGAS